MELPKEKPKPAIASVNWSGKKPEPNAVVRRIVVKELAGGMYRINLWYQDVALPLLRKHGLDAEALCVLEMTESTDKLVKGLNAWLDKQS